MRHLEPVDIGNRLAHRGRRLMRLREGPNASVSSEQYSLAAHVRELDDTRLVLRGRALGIAFQVFLSP